MNAEQVLQAAESAGARFLIVAGRLRYEADPNRPLPAALVQEIGTYKRELALLIRERGVDRPGLLPNDLREVLQGWKLGQAFDCLRKVDKAALDCAAGLSQWSGVDPGTAGDLDLRDEIWSRVQSDPARWRAVFDSMRSAGFDLLTGPHAGPVSRALTWIYSGAAAARSVGEELRLIRPLPDDNLIDKFRKYKNLYHKI